MTLWAACSSAASFDDRHDEKPAVTYEIVIPVHKVAELKAKYYMTKMTVPNTVRTKSGARMCLGL